MIPVEQNEQNPHDDPIPMKYTNQTFNSDSYKVTSAVGNSVTSISRFDDVYLSGERLVFICGLVGVRVESYPGRTNGSGGMQCNN